MPTGYTLASTKASAGAARGKSNTQEVKSDTRHLKPPQFYWAGIRLLCMEVGMEAGSYQFQGTWIPARIHYMLKAGELDLVDVVLLATVDSLVSDTKGCYASNKLLAERVGLSESQTRFHIQKLSERLILIRRIDKGHYREIWPYWNPPDERGYIWLSPNRGLPVDRQGAAGGPAPMKSKERENMSLGIFNHTEENMVGFGIAEPDYSNKTTPSETDTTRAETLLNAIREKRRVNGPRSTKDWARHFRLLLQQDGVTEDRIDKALNWYCANMLGEFVPVVHDAETFRKKFIAIEAAMARGTPAHAGITVTDVANKIVEQLGLQWPDDTKVEELPAAVQMSLDNYTSMLAKLRVMGAAKATATGLEKMIAGTAQNMYEYLTDPVSFTKGWWVDVWRMAHGWGKQHWNGKLLAKAFRPEHKAFRRDATALASRWSGHDMWDKVLERLQDAH